MHYFEFDQQKRISNLAKHGIDFIDAQALWEDGNLIEIQAKSESEPCFLIIGRITNKHWSAIITYRHQNIRIISVRRSRKSEVALYESRRL